MIKAILFDFDGTLVDTFDSMIHHTQELAAQHGYTMLEKTEVAVLGHKSTRELLTRLEIPLLQIPFFVKALRAKLTQEIDHIELISGMREVFQLLKQQGFLIGIVTTNSRHNVLKFLHQNSLNDIDFVHASLHILGKDRTLRKVLQQHHLHQREVIYIGDEVRDIEASQKVGINSIGVTWGFNSTEDIRAALPTHMANKPQDILRILKNYY